MVYDVWIVDTPDSRVWVQRQRRGKCSTHLGSDGQVPCLLASWMLQH
jgi:hypothetical protein